jgi:hypothetical protein
VFARNGPLPHRQKPFPAHTGALGNDFKDGGLQKSAELRAGASKHEISSTQKRASEAEIYRDKGRQSLHTGRDCSTASKLRRPSSPESLAQNRTSPGTGSALGATSGRVRWRVATVRGLPERPECVGRWLGIIAGKSGNNLASRSDRAGGGYRSNLFCCAGLPIHCELRPKQAL